MNSISAARRTPIQQADGNRSAQIPKLHNGDRLSRDEFERRYNAMPEVKKAELIEGVVYMPMAVSDDHAGPHFNLIFWLGLYTAGTPGVVGGDNGTIRLDMENEPQPDAFLRILKTHGGQARIDEDGYVEGAPELVAEVAVSSVSLDLHAKLRVYRQNSAKEYVVWRVEDRQIDWFILRGGEYRRLARTSDGIFQSKVLPGLWLDADAMVKGNLKRVFNVARKGISSRAHVTFCKKLERQASRHKELH